MGEVCVRRESPQPNERSERLIRTVETPEARVAVVAAIGPNERQPEPDTLDDTSSFWIFAPTRSRRLDIR